MPQKHGEEAFVCLFVFWKILISINMREVIQKSRIFKHEYKHIQQNIRLRVDILEVT